MAAHQLPTLGVKNGQNWEKRHILPKIEIFLQHIFFCENGYEYLDQTFREHELGPFLRNRKKSWSICFDGAKILGAKLYPHGRCYYIIACL